jgi:sugar phosphate isomerase/epimerase
VGDVKTIDGPGVFLAQFIAPEPPFDRLETLAAWAADKGFSAVQLPTFNSAIFDLAKAAESETYCQEVQGLLAGHGLVHLRIVDASAGPCAGHTQRLR